MKKRSLLLIIGLLFLIAAAVFAVFLAINMRRPEKPSTGDLPEVPPPSHTQAVVTTPDTAPSAVPSPAETLQPSAEPSPEPYVSPIDFDALRAVNPDIYGWLRIADTNIDYPVVQSPTDDTFYLDHDSDRLPSPNGAIFSEHEYNSMDFEDPVTILYGHHKWYGDIFGNLQQYYSDSEFFDADRPIEVFTEDGYYRYRVFAAVPYNRLHILYYNDFTDEQAFISFFRGVMGTRDLSARFNADYAPEPGDRVLILSTCFAGDNKRRFLVMGTLTD